jgi:hypothetical protein
MMRLLRLLPFFLLFTTASLRAQPEAPEPSEVQKEEDSDQKTGLLQEEKKQDDEIPRRGRNHNQPVIFGSNFLLKPNESVRDLVIIGGNADIQGHVRGAMVLIGGKAKISGKIDQDTVIVMGGADMLESGGRQF